MDDEIETYLNCIYKNPNRLTFIQYYKDIRSRQDNPDTRRLLRMHEKRFLYIVAKVYNKIKQPEIKPSKNIQKPIQIAKPRIRFVYKDLLKLFE